MAFGSASASPVECIPSRRLLISSLANSLCPCAGGFLASAMVPGPAMLGAAAGFMMWEGGSGLLSAVRQGAGLGWTSAGAAFGAASAWMLWRMQLRSLRREQKHDKKADRSLGVALPARTLPDRPTPHGCMC